MKLWCSRDGNGDRVLWLGNEEDDGDEPFYATAPDFCRGSGEGFLDERQDRSSIPIGVVQEILDMLFPECIGNGEVGCARIGRLIVDKANVMDGYGQIVDRENRNETGN